MPHSSTRLRSSVISSSSSRSLRCLFADVAAIAGCTLFDLMVLRDTDVYDIHTYLEQHPDSAMQQLGDQFSPRPDRTITDILAERELMDVIVKWIGTQLRREAGQPPVIAALATYFPDVTSLAEWRRRKAIAALASTVQLGLGLRDQRLADQVVVEIVCGTVLDPCECSQCHRDWVFETRRERKLELLLDSLSKVVEMVDGRCNDTGGAVPGYALALELEPGETYVLNGIEAMKLVRGMLQGDQWQRLQHCVGFNLDIAHMRIAGVHAGDLEEFRDLFLHAHVCDHPGMHTRDQVVGTWTSTKRLDGAYYPYLWLLQRRAACYQPGSGLPFTGAVALELEGCNRVYWIYDSLNEMEHLLRSTRTYFELPPELENLNSAIEESRCLVTQGQVSGRAWSRAMQLLIRNALAWWYAPGQRRMRVPSILRGPDQAVTMEWRGSAGELILTIESPVDLNRPITFTLSPPGGAERRGSIGDCAENTELFSYVLQPSDLL